MAEQPFSDTQLAMLERRWKREPSPHLSLQLADLYRQRQRLADAVAVLERALEEQPGYVSVQVALGRFRLEAGDAAGAAAVLGEVAQRDAGHLVANKLLVKAYLALGDTARASDRLALYALLNDSDPELSALRGSVSQGAPFAAARPAAATDLGSIAPPADRGLTGALDRAPFTQLVERPLHPASLASIFAGIDERWETAAVEIAEPAAVPPAPPKPAAERYETQIFTHEVPLEEAAVEEAEVDETTPAAGPQPREVDPGAGATATLGALYLSQGHLEDARATFEQVLARDPEDAEATAGLEDVARRRQVAAEGPRPPAEERRRNQPKIESLRRYLGRIRAAAARLSA